MTDAFEWMPSSRGGLPRYGAALEKRWEPNNNLRDVSDELLTAIRSEAFLRDLVSLDVPGGRMLSITAEHLIER
jgi:hypothetical protein